MSQSSRQTRDVGTGRSIQTSSAWFILPQPYSSLCLEFSHVLNVFSAGLEFSHVFCVFSAGLEFSHVFYVFSAV